jgi:methionyl-tRNA synthetase
VIANGFITANGVKMSKSLGNGVDPLDLAARYGVDATRYFLLREFPFGEDGDFSEEKMKERYNADLANGLGNFAARVSTLAEKEVLKNSEIDVDFKKTIADMDRAVREKLGAFKFNEALAAIWAAISFGDRSVNEKKVWEIKDTKERSRALGNLVSLLEAVAATLQHAMPETSKKIATAIERSGDEVKVKKIEALFPRIA